ncbi:hypothetical protein LCGC14_3021040 [marine sediment metagenome]|uniref:Uncharacterized protein n=1 Tax=marine sediment metagenome TaxID=412755 RepID=A0A0F8XI73_9ZZZZ
MRAQTGDTVVTMWSEVPAKNVISLPFTGPGCLTEHEFLVKGGKSPTHYRAMTLDAYLNRAGEPHGSEAYLNPWAEMYRDDAE